jgi:2-polyprenyl-3-methyl-5-hydroxy-6-metoxy-1,4-benzoquinol methylase
MRRLDRLLVRLGKPYIDLLTRREAQHQEFKRINERPVEYAFALHWLNRLQPRTVLDVGTGKTAWPAVLRTCGFVVDAIDSVRDYWPAGMTSRYWYVRDDDIQQPRQTPAADVVTCISVLEHIPDQMAAMRGLYEVTKPGGVVLLTTPFGTVGHPNVYTLPGSSGARNPYMCRQHHEADLRAWLTVGFTLEHVEHWRLQNSPYLTVGERIRPCEPSDGPAHLGCFVFRRGEGTTQSL